MTRLRRILALATFVTTTLVSAGLTWAQEPGRVWRPPPPAPDEFDWVQLTSGEWLKGEFIALYRGSLEFDSEELDLLSLDWDDVRLVRTARIVEVRFLGQSPVKGRLFVDGDAVRIVGADERTYDRADLLTVAPGDPREASYWSGRVSFGANFRRGNTDQVEVNTVARGLRRTVQSRVGVEYLGNYNLTNDVTTTDNQRLSANVDWFVSDRVFVRPFQLESYRDPFQNVARRWTLGAAIGYQLIDTPRVDWIAGVGPSYQRTVFDSVTEGATDREDTAAVGALTRYTNELTGRIDYLFELQFLLTKRAAGRYNHHIVTGFEFESLWLLDLGVTLVWDRVQEPRQDAAGQTPKKDDYRLIVGLGFDF